jgi:hypothetical protein
MPTRHRWRALLPNGKMTRPVVTDFRVRRGLAPRQVVDRLERIIAAYPVAAVAVALSTGILVGWWVKRK